jgi:hypothetical protein
MCLTYCLELPKVTILKSKKPRGPAQHLDNAQFESVLKQCRMNNQSQSVELIWHTVGAQ